MHFFTNLFRREDSGKRRSAYASLKIGLIADGLTDAGLAAECDVRRLTPANFRRILREWRPDLVFVESAWAGWNNAWKYQIASYSDYPERTNDALRLVVAEARSLGIPAVFWNKEDGVHYERFIKSASFFSHIFTVDENCVARYKRDVPAHVHVAPLMFPVQPRFHHLTQQVGGSLGFSCFVGSYSRHIHPRRRMWQDMLFEGAAKYGLVVYDRNYKRRADHYRYPIYPGMIVKKGVPYPKTAELYRRYQVNLNVNTVEDSPTMYSRRLIEILAVGGVAVTSPSMAASSLFSSFCYIVRSAQEVAACVASLRVRATYKTALERAAAGAAVVAREHTWERRLQDIENAAVF